MNTTTKLLASALLLALLGACSKEEPPAPVEAPAAAPAPAPVAAPAPAPAPSAGGYEPTAEERVPGVTIPQEELDKKMAELLKDTPKPIIPGEAPAEAPTAPAAEAPAEAAPAEPAK